MAVSGGIVQTIAEENAGHAVAEFDQELFAFRCWCCFLPAGPCEELENLGSYVKTRASCNPNFYNAVLCELQELQDTLRIESTSSAGLRSETLLKAKWSCLNAQKFAVGFLQTRQLRRAQKLGEEVLRVIESCIEKAQADRAPLAQDHHLRALLFLQLLGRMNLGVVYARARRYLDAAELFNQNLALAQLSAEELAENKAERGPKEMVVLGACHTQMYLLNLAIDRVDLATEHAFLAMNVLEQFLPDVPTEEQDLARRSANVLGAAFGNAGVMAVRQQNTDLGIEWLEKALAALGGVLGSSNALQHELKDQLEYARNLRRYSAQSTEEGSKPGQLDQGGPQGIVEGVH